MNALAVREYAVSLAGCTLIVFVLVTGARSQTNPPALPAVTANQVLLKAGTELKLRFAQRVDSRTAVTGDLVELVLDEDVIVEGRLVARKGLRAIARVAEGKPEEKKRQPAKKLVIQLDYLLLGGRQVPVAGNVLEKAKTNAGTVVASGIVFGMIGVLAALSGRHATIPEGTVIPAYIMNDVDVQTLETADRQPAPGPPPGA
jgi:hypothetical protein